MLSSTQQHKFREICIEPPEGAIDIDSPLDRGVRVWKNKGNDFTVFAVHYTADPDKCNDEWYSHACKNLRPDQIERELEINFESKAGTKAFPYLENNENLYRIDPPSPIPHNWRIIVGLDYGARNPTSIHFYAIDEYKRFWAFSEFYKPSNVVEIANYLKNHPYYPRAQFVVADPSIFNKNQNQILTKETGTKSYGTLMSIADLLVKEGIHKIQRANNNRIAGLERMKLMFNFRGDAQKTKPFFFIGRNCPKMWWELNNLVYKLDDNDSKNPEEDVVKRNDHCFVAGTLIHTKRGMIPIEKITTRDMVLTRDGYKAVKACGETGYYDTINLLFTNGSWLTCTGNHPIYTKNRGFINADELSYFDKFLSEKQWLNQNQSFLTESHLEDTQSLSTRIYENISCATQTILKKASDIYTEKFGSFIMGQFPMATIFTTRMATSLTTTYLTLSALPRKNTHQATGMNWLKEGKAQNTLNSSKELGHLQKNGTPLKREDDGMQSIQKGFGPQCLWFLKTVLSAVKSLKQRKANKIEQNFAIKTVEQENLEDVILLAVINGEKSKVFNLSVSDKPEYFANGILVHNCFDDAKYALLSQDIPSEAAPDNRIGGITLKSVEDEIEERYAMENRDVFSCSFKELEDDFYGDE